ncbi:hypothetical protein MAP00_009131 [Monascus purpureus]|nr:hypothetical protein MAP00_009131 [Monascus purpureus]
MPGIQNDLATLAKSLESSQKKVEKAREKGGRGAEKLASAISAVEEANQQWNSRAPFVFEQLQSIDESRINHLRDALTQFETHEADNIERCRQAAESCLNVILNVETADEIKTFAAKFNGGRPVTTRRHDTSMSSREAPLPPPPRIHDDAASQRSGRSGPIRASSHPVTPEPRHTALGGLKRLGTVMNRRKSVIQPSGGSVFPEKKLRSPFAPFRRDTAQRDQLPELGPGSPTSLGPNRPATSSAPLDVYDDPSRTPNEPRGLSRHATEPPIPEAQPAPTNTNGVASRESHLTSSRAANNHTSQVDSEGYSERPQTIDEITRIQREATGGDESGLNLTIRDQPIFEDEDQAKQAMDDMANTLRLQAQKTGVRRNVGTVRGRRDVRNTVFLPNSPPLPGQESLALHSSTDPASTPGSPVLLTSKHVPSASTGTEDHTLSDTTSVRSSHTQHSLASIVPHPDLHTPGLNASIIETVSAWFSEGAVTKSFVVGELALAYIPNQEMSSQNIRVRLDNFEILEKVASNPYFVSDLPSQGKDQDKKGEYNILLSNISRPTPTVAFKYQVHTDQANTSTYCPVIFKPAWNLEESRASVIILYSLDPSFSSTVSSESITIKNLVLTVTLDTSPIDEVTKQPREVAHATNAVMHPVAGAAFRRKHSSVVWKMPELEVKVDGDGKFLVRFTTAGKWPRKGKVEAKFELQTPNAGKRLGIHAAFEQQTEQKETDPFADEASSAQSAEAQSTLTWQEVPTVRKLVTRKYVSS